MWDVDSSVLLFIGINTLAVWWQLRNRSKVRESCDRPKDNYDDDIIVDNNRHFEDLPSHLKRELHKDKKQRESIPRLARKTPLYDNYRMYAPDGTLLCTTSAKKARWYVGKNLAEWVESEDINGGTPRSIRLLFEPKNQNKKRCVTKEDEDRGTMGVNDEDINDGFVYQRTDKDNICVVCGTSEGLMKHYVVPYSYRRKFPPKYKSHHSHDIVLLCVMCHIVADRDGRVPFEKNLDRRYRIGRHHTQHQTHKAMIQDKELGQVKSCARALLRYRERLPDSKRQQCRDTILTHINKQREGQSLEQVVATVDISDELLGQLSEMETDSPNPHYISNVDLIVQHRLCNTNSIHKSAAEVLDDDAIEEFVREWRHLFIDTLQPQFLPAGWSVDSPVSTGY